MKKFKILNLFLIITGSYQKFKSSETIKAVQTIAVNKSELLDWFSVSSTRQRMGKKAIHMGGATQILFGIKDKRWDEHPVF